MDTKILIGLSTGEYIRKADFLPYFLGLDKPPNTVITTVHGQSPAKARNLIIEQALAHDCTHVFFLDDDMAVPSDIIVKLLAHDKDIVTGLYLMRAFPHFPVAFDEAYVNGKNKFMFLTPDKQGLIKITNCGLGCVLIKTDVFKRMQKPWVTLGEIDPEGWCDDVSFFNRVRAAGFELYCDLDVRAGHMTPIMLWPAYHGDTWYTEYRHMNSNVLVPQTIPDMKDVEKQNELDENLRVEKEKAMEEELTHAAD